MGIREGTGGGGGAHPHTHTHLAPTRHADPREGTTHGGKGTYPRTGGGVGVQSQNSRCMCAKDKRGKHQKCRTDKTQQQAEKQASQTTCKRTILLEHTPGTSTNDYSRHVRKAKLAQLPYAAPAKKCSAAPAIDVKDKGARRVGQVLQAVPQGLSEQQGASHVCVCV